MGKVLRGWKRIGEALSVSGATVRRRWKLWGLPLTFRKAPQGYEVPEITVEELCSWIRSRYVRHGKEQDPAQTGN